MTLRTRLVLVHRRSELTELVERHGTMGQVEFYLKSRGRGLEEVRFRHDAAVRAADAILAAAPSDWAVAMVERADLPRFLMQAEDQIVVVGQDGLVANTAKYLDGQLVIGVDPLRGVNPGTLVRHDPAAAARLMLAPETARVAELTMVRAGFDDGQELTALNEVYIGDVGHQTARYELTPPGAGREAQASSGVVVGTGTGATGWCASLAGDRGGRPLPAPSQRRLAWFVREAWPSPGTGRRFTDGVLDQGEQLALTVQSDRLVAFGDGIESDRLTALWGQTITIGLADRALRLAL
ncbi:MAG: hypothetical protein LBK95_03635 [Bifidobacteriaceae bacterium]|jgi:hypothetical protein|nr:hypothetical protein [Bifidobacteriaceae bacterium]